MAAIIRIKRSTGTGAPGSLKTGELAYSAGTGLYNNGGDRLYFGKGDDGAGNATTVEVIGGAYFANLADHAPGTLTASSAIVVDASSKIDALNVDNITIDGNTISSTSTNGNIILDPDGSGLIDVSNTRIINLTDPSGAQDAATKGYVDAQNTAQLLTIIGDANSDTIDLDDSDLTIAGGTGLSTNVTPNTVTINIDNTGVSADTYGSSTLIPVLTINAQGQVTNASTASLATTLGLLATDGPTSGDVQLLDSNLQFTGGEGIDISISGPTVTIAGEDASITNKGVASFDSDRFTVTSGAVTSKQFTIGSTNLNLGDTTTTLAGLTQLDVDNIRIDGNTISSTDVSNTMFIDPAPTDSDGGLLVIRGSLTVQGTTTTVNSTTVSINDKNIVLADSAANAGEADGAGLTINGPTTPATFTYNGSNDEWEMNKTLNLLDSNSLELGGINIKEVIEDHLANNYFLAGEGIDLTYNDGSNTLTITGELATVTNPGVASFDSDQFTVTSGAVTVYQLDGGTY